MITCLPYHKCPKYLQIIHDRVIKINFSLNCLDISTQSKVAHATCHCTIWVKDWIFVWTGLWFRAQLGPSDCENLVKGCTYWTPTWNIRWSRWATSDLSGESGWLLICKIWENALIYIIFLMAFDHLYAYFTKSSSVLILSNLWDSLVYVCCENGFLPSMPFQCIGIIGFLHKF